MASRGMPNTTQLNKSDLVNKVSFGSKSRFHGTVVAQSVFDPTVTVGLVA